MFPEAKRRFDAREKEISTLDEGWAKAALYFRTGEHFGHPNMNIRAQSLVRIHEHLGVYKLRCERGDTLSLLQAVAMCAEENLPLPSWLAASFQSALSKFLQPGGADSLDKVFSSKSIPTDTPKKAATARQDWALGCAIYHETWAAVHSGKTIASLDAALKKALDARDFGVRKTKARELFLMVEKNQLEHLGKKESESLSRFLEVRRKL